MRTSTKAWLVIAALLVLIGCIVFGGVMSMYKWDFSKLSTVKYENNDHVINEDYRDISVITETADVVFVPSENLITSVSCYEQKNTKHSVTVKGGALVIEVVDTRKWYEYIGINFGTPKITVSIPQGEYGTLSVKSTTGCVEIPKDFKFECVDVSVSTGKVTNHASASELIKIKTSTGKVCVENVSADILDLSVTTGNVDVSNVNCESDITVGVSTGKAYFTNTKCKNFVSSGSTGDIFLDNVIAEDRISIKRSTGDVKFNGCDAGELSIKTDTGDVKGDLLTEKVFWAQTDTGKLDVPKSLTGGKCEINTNTGDIVMSICR